MVLGLKNQAAEAAAFRTGLSALRREDLFVGAVGRSTDTLVRNGRRFGGRMVLAAA